ncbi:MAG: PspC domain-containing protein [Oscillochloridaceae bacterium umkhey_bin13]
MQPRLTRSASETMVAGVCGGLAEYFNIDPVIVRLIFVLITLTSGLGLPVYIVLWMIMPRSTAVPSPQEKTLPYLRDDSSAYGQASPAREREVLVGQRQDQSQGRSAGSYDPYAAPASPEFRFDPLTGEPLDPNRPATGRTVNLGMPPTDMAASGSAPRKHSWRTLGLILIGVGGLIFVEQLGVDLSLLFPLMLIVAGTILMRRKR